MKLTTRLFLFWGKDCAGRGKIDSDRIKKKLSLIMRCIA
jgi:hypothetical protein